MCDYVGGRDSDIMLSRLWFKSGFALLSCWVNSGLANNRNSTM
jgi:hypothetical protein